MSRALTLPGLIALIVIVSVAGLPAAAAPTSPTLGTAASFAVLAGSTVTNTGPTVINGDLGLSPGSAVTGFPPGFVNGTQHVADAVALQAQNDVTTAYNDLAGQVPPTQDLSSQDLGGLTLTPGIYVFASSAQLTGALVLDAQGDPYAVFVFQIGSTLTTASNSSVSVINGGSPCNVWWQVGSSATLGTNTTFVGNILALTSITLTTGASLEGRALARNGAVTLDTNVVSASDCRPVLSLRKLSTDANGVPLRPGDVLTYTLIVSNTGQTVATNVSLSDIVPSHTTYVPGSIGGDTGNASGNPLTWAIDTLPPGAGQAVTLTFAVAVDTPLTNGAEIVNTAAVTSTETPTPVTATVTDTVTSAPVLSLSKRSTDANGASLQPGDVVTYTLIVSNTGDAVATSISLTDTVPTYTQYVLNSIAGGDNRGVSGNVLTWTIASLLPGAGHAVPLTFAVTVDTPLSDGTHIVNSAVATSNETPTGVTATVTDTLTPPTAVELLYFRADRLSGQQVRLEWATATEVDNFGFNLYRANVDNLAHASLIHFEPAVTAGSGSGATYGYTDTTPSDGARWYWLADVDTQGRETVHAINITMPSSIASHLVYLPLIVKGTD